MNCGIYYLCTKTGKSSLNIVATINYEFHFDSTEAIWKTSIPYIFWKISIFIKPTIMCQYWNRYSPYFWLLVILHEIFLIFVLPLSCEVCLNFLLASFHKLLNFGLANSRIVNFWLVETGRCVITSSTSMYIKTEFEPRCLLHWLR